MPATCPYPEPDKSIPCPPFHLLKIHFNIILLSKPGRPSGLLPSSFLTKILYTSLLSHIRFTWPAHLIALDLLIRIIFGEQYRSLSSSLCSFHQFSTTSSLLSLNTILNILFSFTLRLIYSLILRDQVSFPFRTISKIVVLCILIFVFLFSNLEDIRFCTEFTASILDFNLHLTSSWKEFWFVKFFPTHLKCFPHQRIYCQSVYPHHTKLIIIDFCSFRIAFLSLFTFQFCYRMKIPGRP